jgi:hypothetical protein
LSLIRKTNALFETTGHAYYRKTLRYKLSLTNKFPITRQALYVFFIPRASNVLVTGLKDNYDERPVQPATTNFYACANVPYTADAFTSKVPS